MSEEDSADEEIRPRADSDRLAGAGGERLRAAGPAFDPAAPAGADDSGRKLSALLGPMRSSISFRAAKASRSRRRPFIARSIFFSSTVFSTRSRAATPMRPASTSVTPIMARCSCARSADGATRSRTSSSTVCCRKPPPAPALRRIGRWSSLWACAGIARPSDYEGGARTLRRWRRGGPRRLASLRRSRFGRILRSRLALVLRPLRERRFFGCEPQDGRLSSTANRSFPLTSSS